MITHFDRERIAARWLIEQDDPAFSDEQREALATWLVESVENCNTYLRLVRAWRRTALLRRNEVPLIYGKRRTAAAAGPGTSRQVDKSQKAPRRASTASAPSGRAGASRGRVPASAAVSASSPRKDRLSRQFGEVLRNCRYDKGWSQDELAARSGVNRAFISQVERGGRSPTLAVLFRLARALGVAPSWLIGQLDKSLGRK